MTLDSRQFKEWVGFRWISLGGLALVAWLVLHAVGVIDWNKNLSHAKSQVWESVFFWLSYTVIFALSVLMFARSYANVVIDSEGIEYRFIRLVRIRWADVREVQIKGSQPSLVRIVTASSGVSLSSFPQLGEIAKEVVNRVRAAANGASIMSVPGASLLPKTMWAMKRVGAATNSQDRLVCRPHWWSLVLGVFLWAALAYQLLFWSGSIDDWLSFGLNKDSPRDLAMSLLLFLAGGAAFVASFGRVVVTHEGIEYKWIFNKTMMWQDVIRVEVQWEKRWHPGRLRLWTRDSKLTVGSEFPLRRLVPLVLEMVRKHAPRCVVEE